MTVFSIAFDVYGTLINTHGIIEELQKSIGGQAQVFSKLWRQKQLEYSFRRGLMREYKNFSVCIKDALEYSLAFFKIKMNADKKNNLLVIYQHLPAFEDAKRGLEKLQKTKHRLYAFSNGTLEAVRSLLIHAGLIDYFLDVISVDKVKSFKPDPKVYEYFLQSTTSLAKKTWLVSSNPFDVLGASNTNFHTAWVQRSSSEVFDCFEAVAKPTIVVSTLEDLATKL